MKPPSAFDEERVRDAQAGNSYPIQHRQDRYQVPIRLCAESDAVSAARLPNDAVGGVTPPYRYLVPVVSVPVVSLGDELRLVRLVAEELGQLVLEPVAATAPAHE
jgi:hypothetical protein